MNDTSHKSQMSTITPVDPRLFHPTPGRAAARTINRGYDNFTKSRPWLKREFNNMTFGRAEQDEIEQD